MENSIIIIAEAGVNHNGDIQLAKRLIDEADKAGADYVKFQTFKTEKNISRQAPKAAYQVTNTEAGESQFDMVKKLELTEEDHYELIRYCAGKNIRFLSTPFDSDSIHFLAKAGIKTGKIPSGEITNLPYLKLMAASFEYLIMSTGMATMDEIGYAFEVLKKAGSKAENITILHCNTEYPTPMRDVNLRAMGTIQEKFGARIGYSDHTEGIEVPIAAAALGATILEKHFTLDKNMEGPDHKASLDPAELCEMVRSVRNIEAALGTGIKEPSASELKNIQIVRKSIYTAKPIKKGEMLTMENLVTKRPGTGISPLLMDEIVGKTALQDMEDDHQLQLTDFQ